jgi:hypothetical protein
MEGFFARTENKPIESLRELEDQLSTRLSSSIESASGAAFSKLLVEGTSEPLENVLRDQLEIALVRSELRSFFDTFSASDLYVELSELVRSSRLIDNVDFYMHVGEIHHAGHIFPAFYLPFAAERTDHGFSLTSEPRLYANKRAMDFVAQEVAKAEGRASTPSSLRERIFYLSPEQRPLQIAQKLLDDMAGGFSQVPLIRDLGDDCEVIAQFELGKYLKQLDPSYRHPDYRVDFLVRVSNGRRQHQLVLEYDGFEFHFEKGVPVGMINATTWRAYLTSEDLEREKVLEGFGVQMIRLNRFNLGNDPVATIDSLLRERLDDLINGGGPHDLVAKMAEKAGEIEKGLKTGEYKRCKKCDRDLPVDMFRDDNAKSGLGRHCRECKCVAPKSHKARFRRSYRR